MALRFRKSVRLAPGLRLNLGTRGASLSAGPRGASITFGRNGLFGNVGIPGTGLSYRTRLDGRKEQSPRLPQSTKQPHIPVTATITSAGALLLTRPDGGRLPDIDRAVALKQNRVAFLDLLDERARDLNNWINCLLVPHLETPAPDMDVRPFAAEPFMLPKPEKPEPGEVGYLESWFGGREKANIQFQEELSTYRSIISEWRAAEENHSVAQQAAAMRHALWRSGDRNAAQTKFEERLTAISWPRETLISYQFLSEEFQADIDLPEVEDMPGETAKVLRKDMSIEMTRKGETERRRDYATHVHSIGFRVAGEAFAAMPTLRSVLISGFSQRISSATGREEEEYLYSARIDRSGWEQIDFNRPDVIDPADALARFELRRDMTRTGVFKPIVPLC